MSFPSDIQGSVRAQLADCLVGLSCQRLEYLSAHRLRVPRCELLLPSSGAKGTIRAGNLSQLTNVNPNLGQSYIIDSFMVVVFGGVGSLWGSLVGGMSMGIVNELLEPYAGAVLAKIFVLIVLILFIQTRPRGLFPPTGRSSEN